MQKFLAFVEKDLYKSSLKKKTITNLETIAIILVDLETQRIVYEI